MYVAEAEKTIFILEWTFVYYVEVYSRIWLKKIVSNYIVVVKEINSNK